MRLVLLVLTVNAELFPIVVAALVQQTRSTLKGAALEATSDN